MKVSFLIAGACALALTSTTYADELYLVSTVVEKTSPVGKDYLPTQKHIINEKVDAVNPEELQYSQVTFERQAGRKLTVVSNSTTTASVSDALENSAVNRINEGLDPSSPSIDSIEFRTIE